ncbi:DUF4382 domain-containing protein [Gaoshiqia sediminis]|uniref:DUF4382 domain-containing protein n=1 Tax=Gaoshiqia sediminis TaxID=2986998 RepID=A0AA42C8T8_9BACT|nr:DUF4382 domain-containing protein [Gaoshiqia sediminis]MCW0481265.1 DUF4382 domain-containing protein [Gaoshiqia sediminis]
MMKAKMKTISMLFLGLLALAFTACNNDEANSQNDGKTTVRFLLTDAPFPFEWVEEANVTIDRVEIRRVGDGEDDGSPFTGFDLEGETTFNLLDLQNGVTAGLGKMELEAGSYDEIRLHVVNANIKLTDGTLMDLKIPSGSSSGLKIKIEGDLNVTFGGFATVLIDFDVSRSFVMQGNANTPAGIKGFIFKPVIRASVTDNTGWIEGQVMADGEALVDSLVNIIHGDDTLTAKTGEEGFYKVMGLPAGTYKVNCEIAGFEKFEQEAAVSVGLGTTVNISFIFPGNIGGVVSTGETLLKDITVSVFATPAEGEEPATTPLATAVSAENGSYLVEGLAPATYIVKCQAEGYTPFVQAGVAVTAKDTTTVNIALVAAAGE